MLCGLNDLTEFFLNLFKKDRLFHGYVFFGEPHLGKFSFALSLANFLENNIFDIPEKLLLETLIVKESGIDCVRKIKNFFRRFF